MGGVAIAPPPPSSSPPRLAAGGGFEAPGPAVGRQPVFLRGKPRGANKHLAVQRLTTLEVRRGRAVFFGRRHHRSNLPQRALCDPALPSSVSAEQRRHDQASREASYLPCANVREATGLDSAVSCSELRTRARSSYTVRYARSSVLRAATPAGLKLGETRSAALFFRGRRRWEPCCRTWVRTPRIMSAQSEVSPPPPLRLHGILFPSWPPTRLWRDSGRRSSFDPRLSRLARREQIRLVDQERDSKQPYTEREETGPM
ncbi:hypothetical protein MTO96_021973 [Rhipicephalus appendiculatus]